MSTSVSRKVALVGATIVMAVLASLMLLPARANAASGNILTGSTFTVGSIVTTLTANCAFDDTVQPFACGGFYSSENGGTDVAVLSNSITYTPGTSFVMTGNILIELSTAIGNCTILIKPVGASFTMSLAAGATYTATITGFNYQLDGCGIILGAAVRAALGGPPATNNVAIDFDIM